WLGKKEGRTYGLPTEAQWEYACRAGSKGRFPFADNEEVAQYAWQNLDLEMKTHAVGQLKPNAWGVYDMHGNIWPWTADWFAADYYQKSPREVLPGPSVGIARAARWGRFHQLGGCPLRFSLRRRFRALDVRHERRLSRYSVVLGLVARLAGVIRPDSGSGGSG